MRAALGHADLNNATATHAVLEKAVAEAVAEDAKQKKLAGTAAGLDHVRSKRRAEVDREAKTVSAFNEAAAKGNRKLVQDSVTDKTWTLFKKEMADRKRSGWDKIEWALSEPARSIGARSGVRSSSPSSLGFYYPVSEVYLNRLERQNGGSHS